MEAVTTDHYLASYKISLGSKAPGTIDAYTRALHHFLSWLADKPGSGEQFQPNTFTRTAVETYLAYLEDQGYSTNYRLLVKSAVSSFANWLINQGIMQRNPTRDIQIPVQPLMAPRILSADQRYVLRNLVEREGSLRGSAIFALGYWAGCRVSDVSWLRLENTHIGKRRGWLLVGHKRGQTRQIDLYNQARRALYDYLYSDERKPASEFVFTSQRADRLTEAGIHHWLRALKKQSTKDEWELIHDVTFHDLRHDFAHRARKAGWMLEEVAYYLGHITSRGAPAVQTTARYTQASREQIRDKLKLLSG